jgi:hypothetical protein
MDATKWRILIAAAVPYGVGVSALYAYFYWRRFGINALEFISLADVLRLSLYPLASGLFVFLIGLAVIELARGDALPPGGGRRTKIGEFLWTHRRAFWLTFTAAVLLLVYLSDSSYMLFYLAGLGTAYSTVLSHFPVVVEVVPNARARSVLLTAVVGVALLSIAVGDRRARDAQDGRGVPVVDVARSGIGASPKPKLPVVFLGFIGDFAFLYETSTRTTLIVRPKEEGLFLLPRAEN